MSLDLLLVCLLVCICVHVVRFISGVFVFFSMSLDLLVCVLVGMTLASFWVCLLVCMHCMALASLCVCLLVSLVCMS